MSTNLTFKQAHLPSGIRIRYALQGSEDAPGILMLHGFTDSWFSFSRVLRLLPHDVRAIVPDQRGHGDSDKPESCTPDAMASDAIALLDALGVAQATVVGHCMGGFIAQRVAAMAPERVSGLLLVATAATMRTAAIEDLLRAVEALDDDVSIDFVRDFQSSTIHRPVPTEFFHRVVTESLKVPARVWKSVLGSLDAADAVPVPAGIPVRIFWGDRDAVFSRDDQEALLRHIPRARLTVVREVGHALHWEAPEVVVPELVGVPA
jgi:pimeloyl-ACP methyl ester carboxylesterase